MPPLLQVCCALAQIAKHSVDLAEVVVEAEVFPKILTCLKFPDELVRKHTATVVREVRRMQPSWRPLVSFGSRVCSMGRMTPSRLSWVVLQTHVCLFGRSQNALCNAAAEAGCQFDSQGPVQQSD